MRDMAAWRRGVKSLLERPVVRWLIPLAVLAAIVGTAAQSYRHIDRELTAVTLVRREAVAQLLATTLAEKFGRLVDVAISLATRPLVRDLVAQGKWNEAVGYLRTVPRDLPQIERLFLVDTRGTLKADAPPLPAVRGNNFAHREWFQGVSHDWQPFISPIYQRAAAPRLNVFAVAVPVRNMRGEPAGILVLQIRVESLIEWVNTIDLGPEGFIYIVDSKGQVAYDSRHPGREEITDLSAIPVTERLQRGQRGVEIGFDPVEREDSIVAYAALPGYSWGIVTQQPARASLGLAARNEQLRRLLAGYGIILLLGAAVIVLVARIAVARKRAESDARFSTIVNAAADAIISIDPDQRVVLFNHGAETIFGYRAAEMLGQPLERLLPVSLVDVHRRHVRDFANAPENRRTSRHMADGREIAGRRRDGTEFPIEASIAKSAVNGQVALTVILRDISERQRAEQALRDKENLLNIMGAMAKVGGWEFDARTLKGTWTDEVARIHDLDPAEETGVEKGLAFYQGEHRERIEAAVKAAIEHGTPYDMELEMITAKANHKWVRTIAQPVVENGKVVKVRGSFQDITERKLAEEEIRRLNTDLERKVIERTAELEAANKELEAFSYSVSHDLRAPLRSIDGFSQALLEDYAPRLDTSGQDYLRRVRAATQRMAELIDDLLQLSRVTRAEMRRVSVDLSELAAETVSALRHAHPDRTVEMRIEPNLSTKGDPKLLRILLVNLLGNAWKFTSKRPDARIEVGLAGRDNGRSVFFVRDNGAGFDPTYADKLFTAFQRLHSPVEFPGTGIGLATVQRIVNRHGGRAWAEGRVNEGATFYFQL